MTSSSVTPPDPAPQTVLTRIDGAVAYLEAAAMAAATREPVTVPRLTAESETLVLQVANRHGFVAFLARFRSAIDNNIAHITEGISTKTEALLAEGIAGLKKLV